MSKYRDMVIDATIPMVKAITPVENNIQTATIQVQSMQKSSILTLLSFQTRIQKLKAVTSPNIHAIPIIIPLGVV